MKTLTSLLCLKCPNVFPPHSHWVKVPIMASKVRSGLDYLSDLSFSPSLLHRGYQPHWAPGPFLNTARTSETTVPTVESLLLADTCHGYSFTFRSLLKCHAHHPTTMDYPFVALFFPVAVVIMIFIYFTNVLYVFVYYLISAHSLITPWNISLPG